MTPEFLFKGLILGFSVAAPVGPIGILCINRTINRSFASGFVSGLGAATADLLYGLIAGFGLTAISSFLISQKMWIQMVGLVFLFYLGTKTLMKREPDLKINQESGKGLLKDYFSTLLITITNPVTILFFVAVFASLGLSQTINELSSVMLLVAGVFSGSVIWWLFLSGLTHQLKSKMNKSILRNVDLISGITIWVFGIMILIEMIR